MSEITTKDIENTLMTYIRENLLKDSSYELTRDEPLITGGLIDSYAIAQISIYVEDEYGIFIPDDELTVERMDTVEDMAQVVKEYLDE